MTRHDHVIDFIEFPAGDVGQLDRGKRFFADVFGWTYRDWGEADIRIRPPVASRAAAMPIPGIDHGTRSP